MVAAKSEISSISEITLRRIMIWGGGGGGQNLYFLGQEIR